MYPCTVPLDTYVGVGSGYQLLTLSQHLPGTRVRRWWVKNANRNRRGRHRKRERKKAKKIEHFQAVVENRQSRR